MNAAAVTVRLAHAYERVCRDSAALSPAEHDKSATHDENYHADGGRIV